MKWSAVVFIFLMFSTSAFAQSREDINAMLERFKASGMFSEEDIKRAQGELMQMSDQEVKELKDKASERVMDPDIQRDLRKLK